MKITVDNVSAIEKLLNVDVYTFEHPDEEMGLIEIFGANLMLNNVIKPLFVISREASEMIDSFEIDWDAEDQFEPDNENNLPTRIPVIIKTGIFFKEYASKLQDELIDDEFWEIYDYALTFQDAYGLREWVNRKQLKIAMDELYGPDDEEWD